MACAREEVAQAQLFYDYQVCHHARVLMLEDVAMERKHPDNERIRERYLDLHSSGCVGHRVSKRDIDVVSQTLGRLQSIGSAELFDQEIELVDVEGVALVGLV